MRAYLCYVRGDCSDTWLSSRIWFKKWDHMLSGYRNSWLILQIHASLNVLGKINPTLEFPMNLFLFFFFFFSWEWLNPLISWQKMKDLLEPYSLHDYMTPRKLLLSNWSAAKIILWPHIELMLLRSLQACMNERKTSSNPRFWIFKLMVKQRDCIQHRFIRSRKS